jgi:hypothetical protein
MLILLVVWHNHLTPKTLKHLKGLAVFGILLGSDKLGPKEIVAGNAHTINKRFYGFKNGAYIINYCFHYDNFG